MIERAILRVGAVALPAVLAVLWLTVEGALERDRQLRGEALLTARFLAAAVDRELEAIEAGLQMLAGSQALADNDLAALHHEASAAARTQIVNNIVLSNGDGAQLMNTLKPWGTPLPARGNPPQLQTVFSTRQTVVTGVFVGPVTGTPLVAIGIPVLQGRDVAYSLGAGISSDRLRGVLKQPALPEDWIATIVDREGRVIARTRDLQRFAGQPVAQDLRDLMLQQREGVADFASLEGSLVVGAFSPSRAAGWTIAVGVPSAHLRRPALAHAVIVLATVAITGLLAWRMTRTRP